MLLMYVLVVLPLEVAFANFQENDVTGVICTLVFVADILICFRTGALSESNYDLFMYNVN
jgi:hypothetical protein